MIVDISSVTEMVDDSLKENISLVAEKVYYSMKENISSDMERVDDSLTSTVQEPHWFASLSDSELDLLTSIKELVISRAKSKGYEDVALEFSLDMYRGIGVILLEDLKERMKNNSLLSKLFKGSDPLDRLHMMTADNIQNSASLIADVSSLHCVTPKQKRKADTSLDGRYKKTKRRGL